MYKRVSACIFALLLAIANPMSVAAQYSTEYMSSNERVMSVADEGVYVFSEQESFAEISGDDSGETSGETSGGTSGEVPGDNTDETPADTSDGTPTDTPGGNPDISDDTSDENPGDNSDETPEENPDEPGENPDDNTGDPAGISGEIPGEPTGDTTDDPPAEEPVHAEKAANVTYRTYLSNNGWLPFVKNGKVSGSVKKPKRVEALKVKITDKSVSGGVTYRVNVQDQGWSDWKKNGQQAGTKKKNLRLEAVQIQLYGKLADKYDIYYRLYATDFGWLGWAMNGAKAGTIGFDKTIAGIQIKLVKKGFKAPGSTVEPYKTPLVRTCSYMQKDKWQTWKYDGATSGLPGKGKRMESLRISFYDTDALGGYPGSVKYRVFVEEKGWRNWVYNGGRAGTGGSGKRIEALEVKLTGTMQKNYSIYYRVYVQSLGWLAWTKDGCTAGTNSYGLCIQAVQVKILPKDELPVSGRPYLTPVTELKQKAWLLDGTCITAQENGCELGCEEQTGVMEAISISNPKGTAPTGNLSYRVSLTDKGWQDWVMNGVCTGTEGEGVKIQAIRISLGGKLEKLNNVYYRVCTENFGWLAWTKNGSTAGTLGYHCGIKCIQIMIVPKGFETPSTKGKAYMKALGAGLLMNPCPGADYVSSEFGYRDAPTYGASSYHQGRDYAAKVGTPILAATTGKVVEVSYSNARGNYVILDHGNKMKTLYQHCDEILVKEGASVMVGTKIATVGETGIVTGAHLHFEVWIKDKPVDPRLYL